MTKDQQTSAMHAAIWISIARDEKNPSLKEQHTQRAIRNLMVASHGR